MIGKQFQHSTTPRLIPSLNFIPQIIYKICSRNNVSKSEAKATVAWEQIVTLCDLKIYLHNIFGIPSSNDKGDRSKSRSQ